jgi:hypothetical protein
MRAGLSTPDGSVIHARQIVEDERGRVRKFDAAGRRQDALQRIVAKDLPRGNGNKSAPAMAAAKRSVARGAGNIGVRSLGKIMRKSSTARRTSALVASKSTAAIAPDRTAPVMRVSPDQRQVRGKGWTTRSDFLPKS